MEEGKSKLKHLEPPCWWVGMKNHELMLLVHGTSVAQYSVVVSYEGVEVERVEKTENPNYLFVFLHISTSARPGSLMLNFNKDGKVVFQQAYELKQRWQGSAERNSFGPQDVVYLLMPDRFCNGNPKIDATPFTHEKANRKKKDGRHGGDLQGIISKLIYLADLGITALWLTPVLEDNMPRVSYHGYACTNLYKIDPRFGSLDDYLRLSSEAKKRGLKLIQDMVPNHIGAHHWWMEDLPAHDWVHTHESYTQSNHRIEVWHDPYRSDTDETRNETGWFDTSMPDLNQSNPLVLAYLQQQAIWWVEIADLDGVRVDTFPYVDQWEAAEWVKAIRREYPNLTLVGECWLHHPAQIAYWQSGVKNRNGYDSHLPSVMDFPWQEAVHCAFNEDEQHWAHGMARLYQHFTMDYLYADPNYAMVFLDNHDINRISEALQQDVKKLKLAIAHLLTTRGIPQWYYGTEIMLGGKKQAGDDDIRREIPGGWPGDKRDAFTRKGRTPVENEVFNFSRKLLHYRKKNAVLQTGKMVHFIPENNVYVYFRFNHEKTVMVLLNNSIHLEVVQGERFREMFHGFSSAHNILTGRKKAGLTVFRIPAKSAQIFELQ